jgi:hypothetical protein
VLGGVFWIGAAFAGPYVYGGQSVSGAFGTAIFPLIFTAAVLIIGWFQERFAAIILAIGAIGTIAWGLINGTWEPFVWGIMLAFFVAPTIVSAVLFFLAGNSSGDEPEPADASGTAAG